MPAGSVSVDLMTTFRTCSPLPLALKRRRRTAETACTCGHRGWPPDAGHPARRA
jgi:hypothetical protein